MSINVRHGDCLELLPSIPDNSIDAIVTDPPYHLVSGNAVYDYRHHNGKRKASGGGFMGKQWDGGDIAFRPDVWQQCLRVLKPGGYLVAFGGCRTYHRLVVAIEDAGFVIHPMLAWAFGQGFPKASNASKMIDKHLGAEREVTGSQSGGGFKSNGGSQRLGTSGQYEMPSYTGLRFDEAATASAKQWEGWSYGLQSLKPSIEPICMAQKPMEGTGAQNILKWGVGALNIAACRVPTEDATSRPSGIMTSGGNRGYASQGHRQIVMTSGGHAAGRWPPNLLHDGSPEVLECFPQSSPAGTRGTRCDGSGLFDMGHDGQQNVWHNDQGSAARFFPALGYSDEELQRVRYQAKAGKRDRCGSKHPTVKPVKLIEWLCKLICPPGGTILDPFAGSGTTGQAACNLGFDCVLIEREAEYIQDIERRVNAA